MQPAPVSELAAPAHWQVVDVLSDTHLHAPDPATFAAWRRHLQTTPAQAVFILGDWFDVWVGDDVLDQNGESVEAQAMRCMREASERLSLHVMVGNRDFLLGQRALAAANAQALHDPAVLSLGPRPDQRVLLSHGDAWCTTDVDYQRFRLQVRQSDWQQAFLNKPLNERLQLAAHMRQQSMQSQKNRAVPIDVTESVVADAAALHLCAHVVHGHTHRGTSSGCGAAMRHVTLDWHASQGQAQVIRLSRNLDRAWTIDRLDVGP